ncbi:MAG: hypothetical protein HQL11_01375 [Candidatus Omnitrophica bacterium]|nr:hypothetical protein [Candidatus Omnitrophota bacterium]
MIVRMDGHLAERSDHSVTLNVGGIHHEVFVAAGVLRDMEALQEGEAVSLVIYHYVQSDPSRSIPVLIGFKNKIEREFFEKFITVSGIGPRAALKALSVAIPQIATAIDQGDRAFLKTLPGVGDQRAREIIAKLEGKVGKFALIRDGGARGETPPKTDLEEEAMQVLLQLQYRKDEAQKMLERALGSKSGIQSVEELLNEVYRQKMVSPAREGDSASGASVS